MTALNLKNLLPYDGEVYLLPLLDLPDFSNEEIYQTLLNELPWQSDVVTMFGKTHITRRQVVWMGDDNIGYRYSGHLRTAIAWQPLVFEIKRQIEVKILAFLQSNQILGSQLTPSADPFFNSCLLNYYPTGEDGMGYHADNEKELGDAPMIASISFGATRKIAFKHKVTKEKIDVILPPASVLLMLGATQSYWQHSIPKTKKVQSGRISLTFRKILA
ncbi:MULTISPECIES: alpha-ketoglutarate-dependent dioxygenase AlkB [Psychrobacter]|uniref:alpha-ketoglutarate-dependent dioxygenase AlkB family protein n=1 Tax=Psychrobacter TaxID=497 RepID=UPI00146DA269|nr:MULTISPECIES: alpha-ketoglutarate-dependent dioxygenase AlkB [Psychrobacter]